MNYLKTKAFQNHPLKSNIPVCIGGVNHKNWFQNYYDYSKLDKWTIFRNLAKDYGLEVQMRLEWMIFYEKVSKKNAGETSKHYEISTKTFHKWHKRFTESKSNVESLLDRSKAPIHKRKKEISGIEELRIVGLRKKHMRYGKKKIRRLYLNEYKKDISTWKISYVISGHNLYPDKTKHIKLIKKRARGQPKTRIMNYLKTNPKIGICTLWHIDSIILYYGGFKRAIITAIDEISRIGYARVYKTANSKSAEDFLERLEYLVEGTVLVAHTDNGSEFGGLFKKACEGRGIKRIYSRTRTPKDNGKNERFNRTIQEEWLEDAEITMEDIKEANESLTGWLIEYNAFRPHESHGGDTPVEYVKKVINSYNSFSKVLPMYPACTSS